MRQLAALLSLAFILPLTGCQSEPDNEQANKHSNVSANSKHSIDDYYDLGGFNRPVTCENRNGQIWFDRGLAMCYAFNHEEAVRCFESAIKNDPGMAMSFWGMAHAMGPNINNMEIPSDQIAQAAMLLKIAKLHSGNNKDWEKDLIEASMARYQTPVPEISKREPLNLAYSDAMRKLHKKYPENPTITALFAEALMCLRPWHHWSKDGKPAKETPEILKVIEGGLKKWPNHPALCHFYIHAMEASPTPEKALDAANRLGDAMPGAGHLVHMPSHIYVLVGDYESVIQANQKAIKADNEYARREGNANFYTLYRAHNFHFLVYGAMFDGQRKLALKAAREMRGQIPAELLRAQTDFLDAFVPTELHVMVRFGMWDEILEFDQPDAFLPVSRSIWHYARAIAYAAKGDVENAIAEQKAFNEIRETVPETSVQFNNPCENILAVAESMIAGEIQYRKGNYEEAFELLREAVRRDDALNYDEPWGWMQPTRHALAALLLEQGHYEKAEAVYREDLKRRPNNPWSLRGLADCLIAQKREQEAEKVVAQFNKATKRSDIKIQCSCFCKNGKLAEKKK